MIPSDSHAPRFRAAHSLLLVLFAASGCSALIYEIVWYQLLQLTIGATAFSLSVLLATFMGGLCLGSTAVPRLAAIRRAHPLRVFAALELAIAACGILVGFGIPLVSRVYIAGVGHGLPAILLRGVVCSICLLLPTLLMGASLPVVARWAAASALSVRAFRTRAASPAGTAAPEPANHVGGLSPQAVRWVGFWYGANTAGAVFGCLLAGFYLLRVFDMAIATSVAVAINTAVAAIAFGMSLRTDSHAEPVTQPEPDDPEPEGNREGAAPEPAAPPPLWAAYAAIALSGAAALGAEVVWTRLLGLILGPTVYTFSVVLAVFLVGLALGSAAGSLLASAVRPGAALGYCQLLLVAAIAWTAFALTKSVPYWPINPKIAVSPWITFQIDLVRVLWSILPATVLWGASFPLAVATVREPSRDSCSESDGSRSSRALREDDPARPVAGVYAANTGGAILGALFASMLLIPHVGTQHTEQVLIALSLVGALLLLTSPSGAPQPRRSGARAIGLSAAALLAGLLIASVPALPPEVIAWGRLVTTSSAGSHVLYAAEGLNSSIAVSQSPEAMTFHISGKIEASTNQVDMRMQRMLADVPALLHPAPRSVLVVGFGAGVTAGSFVPNPDVRRIVVCEMEPLVPPASTKYFARQNFNVLHDRRTEIVYDDARSYILTSSEKFDVVTSDPIHPWVKGSAALYTREYFQLVKRHLRPGGLVAQWVPMYETDIESVKSEIATFFEVFPSGTIWANQRDTEAYDLVLLGSAEPLMIDVDRLQQRLNQRDYATLVGSLGEVDLETAVKLLSTYGGRARDLKPWLADAQINRDGNLRLQYLAGLGVNAGVEKQIYTEISNYRAFPTDMFRGSDFYLQSLYRALE